MNETDGNPTVTTSGAERSRRLLRLAVVAALVAFWPLYDWLLSAVAHALAGSEVVPGLRMHPIVLAVAASSAVVAVRAALLAWRLRRSGEGA